MPAAPRDLHGHLCIVLRENDVAYGTWHLSCGRKQETIKVRGALSSNDGETALVWALDGHGVLMRSEWDVYPHLRSGALEIVLPEWSLPGADVHAVHGERLNASAKVVAFVDFLAEWFGHAGGQAMNMRTWIPQGD
ncbi:LysR substrate binding domain-containing protein [Paraburkholderia rhizosphaerae]|uniref:LysR substrate binding domain-containing protein n=1 Tax=Paraburkholderia rhizosphaerae TaxID=480658 RepID=A0A4R8L4Y5_9BURK|nr:LysR substrate binding domain-containing protein [Paraburkholderia rhizosphaerae]